jgi:hypothetical protein
VCMHVYVRIVSVHICKREWCARKNMREWPASTGEGMVCIHVNVRMVSICLNARNINTYARGVGVRAYMYERITKVNM